VTTSETFKDQHVPSGADERADGGFVERYERLREATLNRFR
jgi:hypothetical protein